MEAQLSSFLKQHYPDFEQLESVERLSGGASQETYRLRVFAGGQKKQLAFRRANGGVPSDGTQATSPPQTSLWEKITTHQEAQLMQIAKKYGVPEPEVIALCSQSDGLGEGFVMEWLEGETLGKKVLALAADKLAAAQPSLAFHCGAVLSTIHQIPLAQVEHLNLPQQTTSDILNQSYEVYQSLSITRPMIDYTARWLKENQPQQQTLCLTHNDFRNGNLMVSSSGLVGVLDWELAAISEPMRDLGWLCAHCWRFGGDLPVGGFGSYEDLFAGYRSVGTGVADLLDEGTVKFWEVMSSFRWAIMCLGMAHVWRTGSDRSLERAAIGRRVSESELDCANLLLGKTSSSPLPQSAPAKENMPTKEELIDAVREHLLESRKTATTVRDRFLALVAANSLDIVQRELAQGPALEAAAKESLEIFLGQIGEVSALRKILVDKIKTKQVSLKDEGVQDYLRQQTLGQVLIDQPTYAGARPTHE